MAPNKQPKNLFAEIHDRVRAINADLIASGSLPKGVDQSRVVVEPPRDASHGDMTTNAAMVLANDAGKKPRELAEAIAAKLRAEELVQRAEVAGPGFINLTLKPQAWEEALRGALRAGADYGRSEIGQGEKVNVEYVSANPTGPMHVGHGRGRGVRRRARQRAGLRRLCRDAGILRQRFRRPGRCARALGVICATARRSAKTSASFRKGFIPATTSSRWAPRSRHNTAASLKTKPEAEWLSLVRAKAIEIMLAGIRDDLAALKVRPDVFFSERSLIENGDKVGATIEALRKQGHVHEGRLPPPRGATIEDWEDREQTLFRATEFGDDVDRPLVKPDGSYTYFASDIAYHKSKFERGFTHMIDVWGADHGGYVKRMQAAVKAVTGNKAELDVKIVQLVKLLRAGEPVKMSKRAGEFVTLARGRGRGRPRRRAFHDAVSQE